MKNEQDALNIIARAYERMKEEGVGSYRGGKPNLAELSRRTGYTRKVLERAFKNGLKAQDHGNSHKRGSHVMTGQAKEKAEELLRQGVSNSSVVFEKLCEAGYKGSLTTVKNFIRENKDIMPAKRIVAVQPQGKISRYETGPGEMFQMDWGFVNVVDWTGMEWKCACFAMVCHHCGMRYVEFFPNAKQENLFIGMIHAFMLMGVPDVVLTDNMASVTRGRDCYGNVIYNHNYDSLQQVLGFVTRLLQAEASVDKGRSRTSREVREEQFHPRAQVRECLRFKQTGAAMVLQRELKAACGPWIGSRGRTCKGDVAGPSRERSPYSVSCAGKDDNNGRVCILRGKEIRRSIQLHREEGQSSQEQGGDFHSRS